MLELKIETLQFWDSAAKVEHRRMMLFQLFVQSVIQRGSARLLQHVSVPVL